MVVSNANRWPYDSAGALGILRVLLICDSWGMSNADCWACDRADAEVTIVLLISCTVKVKRTSLFVYDREDASVITFADFGYAVDVKRRSLAFML